MGDLAAASERRGRGGFGRRWGVEGIFALELLKIGLGPGGHGGKEERWASAREGEA